MTLKRPPKHNHRCPTCGHRVGLSLTPKDVQTIRALLKGGAKLTTLAQAYEVSKSCIYKIKSGKNWGTV